MAWTLNRGVLLVGTAVLLLSACDRTDVYKGDGKLVDNGLFAAKDRHVLDLGALPLSKNGSRSYQLGNLPNESFVVGLQLTGTSKVSLEGRPLNPLVAIELRDGNGKVLMNKRSPLKEWTWSVPSTNEWAFIYGEGKHETFFKPAPGATFLLSVEVADADPAAEPYTSRLVAKAGGWK
jgi:hypothetical protein